MMTRQLARMLLALPLLLAMGCTEPAGNTGTALTDSTKGAEAPTNVADLPAANAEADAAPAAGHAEQPNAAAHPCAGCPSRGCPYAKTAAAATTDHDCPHHKKAPGEGDQ